MPGGMLFSSDVTITDAEHDDHLGAARLDVGRVGHEVVAVLTREQRELAAFAIDFARQSSASDDGVVIQSTRTEWTLRLPSIARAHQLVELLTREIDL